MTAKTQTTLVSTAARSAAVRSRRPSATSDAERITRRRERLLGQALLDAKTELVDAEVVGVSRAVGESVAIVREHIAASDRVCEVGRRSRVNRR